MAENAECRKLYKIASGKCTMEVEVAPGRNEISNVLRVCFLYIWLRIRTYVVQENDLFGESTFLLGGEIKVSVIAQTDIEVYPAALLSPVTLL